ncbi:hypothetical protein [Stenotrophomonas sp. UBA7606]|uniref:hypothetical protein n=1 Tax=Stenotrophomonas sp. UBA7606 TaxID=1947559 RepID=UPI0025DA99DA|nr:hypothetical protein [Stenotrophomonas sp. UBA7606]
MNTSDHLTPEERDLARLLGRPGARAQSPSAQVDADILARARAPLSSATPAPATTLASSTVPTAQRHGWRRRRRLTSSLAVAASLVLVVGLAWQLQPTAPTIPQHGDSAVQATDTPAAAAADASGGAEVETVPPPAAVVEAPAQPAPAAEARKQASASDAAAKAEPMPAPASPPTDAPMADAYAAPAAAPPPPPAPVAIQAEPASALANSGASNDAPLALRAPRPPFEGPRTIPHAGEKATAKAAAARRERAAVAAAPAPPADMTTATAAPVVDVEADTRLSRRHWLKRIRERLDAGDLDGARASLRRFAHDYPEARVPKDLQPLLKD